MEFTKFNLCDGFFGLRDSMCYDSGLVALSAEVKGDDGHTYEIYIETQGHVKVFWHGEMYKHASQMPEELIEAYYNGTIDTDDDYDVCENNWWEFVCYCDGKYSDCIGGLLECNPADFTDENDVKDYILQTIAG